MRWESILDYPDEPNAIKWALNSKEAFLAVVRERRDVGRRVRDATLLALEEEGATSQRLWAASGRQERPGDKFSSRTSRKERSPVGKFDFNPMRPESEFYPTEL